MSGRDLNNSTILLDPSSGGVFQTHSTEPWNPSGFSVEKAKESEHSTSGLRVGWSQRQPHGSWFHAFEFMPQGTNSQTVDWRSVLERSFCHLIVDLLPERALKDLKQNLIDAIEFYSHEKLPTLQPSSIQRTAQVIRRHDREQAILDEE